MDTVIEKNPSSRLTKETAQQQSAYFYLWAHDARIPGTREALHGFFKSVCSEMNERKNILRIFNKTRFRNYVESQLELQFSKRRMEHVLKNASLDVVSLPPQEMLLKLTEVESRLLGIYKDFIQDGRFFEELFETERARCLRNDVRPRLVIWGTLSLIICAALTLSLKNSDVSLFESIRQWFRFLFIKEN